VRIKGVSVVICCYNSADRILETLLHLQRQHVSQDVAWEVIVVDNASTDTTVQVATQTWGERSIVPMRIISEPQNGVAFARTAGVRAARFSYVSFVDDDNRVCKDWIARVYSFFESHPAAGVVGSKNEVVADVDLPWWFERFQQSYATGPQANAAGDITWREGVVCGAGMSIRAAAWQDLFEKGFSFTLLGRIGKQMTCGEDYELSLALRLAGWRIWYEPEITLQHYMPVDRLTWQHLRKMVSSFGFVRNRLNAYGYEADQNQLTSELRWRTLLKRTLAKLVRFKLLKLIGSRFLDYEGDADVVMIDLHLGSMKELLILRDGLSVYQREIASAAWNRTGERSRPISES